MERAALKVEASRENRSVKPPQEGTPVKTVRPGTVKRKNGSVPRSSSSSADEKLRKIGAYAVQCANCFKFRLIPTEEEYETIRQNFIEEPWVCSRKADVSCDDPADLESDATTLLVIDKPNLPKTPASCQRTLVMRKDFSKLDATYVMPNGKRMRSSVDVEKFLEAYPQYKSQFSVHEFSFTVPKIMEGISPSKFKEGGSASTSKIVKKTDERMKV